MSLALAQYTACVYASDPTGTGDDKGGNKVEVARWLETLALGSEGKSTKKPYLVEWNTSVEERTAQSEEPWLQIDESAD